MKALVCTAALLTFAVCSFAQGSTYSYCRSWLTNNGYTICADKYADLTEGGDANFSHNFADGLEYKIIAFSDDSDVTDVDVYVRTSDGRTIREGASADELEEVNYEPVYSGLRRIHFTNHKSNTPFYASRCRVLVAYR